MAKSLAVNYITFGHHHMARLAALHLECRRRGFELIGVQTFSRDSDYDWKQVPLVKLDYRAETIIEGESASWRKSPMLAPRIRRYYDDLNPDVVVVSGWGLREARLTVDWCKKRKRMAVLLSDSQESDAKRNWFKEYLKRNIVRRFDAAFVAGRPQARYAMKLGMRADRVCYGSCAVDNHYWTNCSKAIRQDCETSRMLHGLPLNYFLFVGRFVAKKNVLTLLKAYSMYRDQVSKPLSLILCGSGEQEHAIREFVDATNLRGVQLRGFQQADALPYYYALADCLILPSSHCEQWGLVVNEAMASGLPVLVSYICGCAEDLVHDGINGFTFNPHNPKELAEKMLRITSDSAVRARMGTASLETIGQYSCEWAAQNLLDCICQII
jgi:1,2-diacylglycerol 3-alpha-glucosyltransferase